MVEQVTGTVRWRESISWLAGEGVDTFVEVGTGKVLTGMDLSEGMLRKAAGLKQEDGSRIYDHLVEAELVTFLNEAPRDCFGMALSVDTLIYFGALEELMTELYGALRPGGMVVTVMP